MPTSRLFVIYNPVAGQRRRKRLAKLVHMLRQWGHEVVLKPTEYAGHAADIVTSTEAQAADRIIVAGGDGTLNEAVNGLVDHPQTSKPIMFAPLGTANVMAHEMSYPSGFKNSVRALLAGADRPVRLAVANGRHFMLMVSVGLDAWAVAGVNAKLKKVIGPLAYIASGTIALKRYFSGLSYEVSLDDAAPVKAVTVVVQRGRKYGGPFIMAPDAGLQTDKLHVMLWERGGLFGLLELAWGLLFNRMKHIKSVSFHQAQRVRIEGSNEDPVQMDGDDAGHLPLEISMTNITVPLVYPAL